jgi:lincosamide nucleotidyltransferase A/C/D/E
MTPGDVIAVVQTLESAGVVFWLDGGRGVDALLGRQTRPHGDLDLALDRDGADGRDHGRGAGVLALHTAPVEVALLADAARTIATQRA